MSQPRSFENREGGHYTVVLLCSKPYRRYTSQLEVVAMIIAIILLCVQHKFGQQNCYQYRSRRGEQRCATSFREIDQ